MFMVGTVTMIGFKETYPVMWLCPGNIEHFNIQGSFITLRFLDNWVTCFQFIQEASFSDNHVYSCGKHHNIIFLQKKIWGMGASFSVTISLKLREVMVFLCSFPYFWNFKLPPWEISGWICHMSWLGFIKFSDCWLTLYYAWRFQTM